MPADSPILIVDDEPHIRRVAELSMRPLGLRVLTATDGREALDIARRERPCIILLDHIMPVMDGKETLRELKSSPDTQDIPVVIFSARGQLARGQHHGFEDASLFITKPFSPSQLRKDIQRLLGLVLSA
ncbi:MAG: response regulator [Prosthecobacter sp.]|uniref:response regulator n=1 Tax=Prosthecobacter sp. TaxID=1965333 RepID=UPI001A00D598|nr:response regulator [Prosthecobacter sp.]MBE2286278.1 response regulator [Prosthecobacter sp.]